MAFGATQQLGRHRFARGYRRRRRLGLGDFGGGLHRGSAGLRRNAAATRCRRQRDTGQDQQRGDRAYPAQFRCLSSVRSQNRPRRLTASATRALKMVGQAAPPQRPRQSRAPSGHERTIRGSSRGSYGQPGKSPLSSTQVLHFPRVCGRSAYSLCRTAAADHVLSNSTRNLAISAAEVTRENLDTRPPARSLSEWPK